MRIVVGTAGHIDHGKTALLQALTGIDADRLPEEQRRGMTIDVGYAHLALRDGSMLDFVDVPGHDRLVGNMLVGAGEIDAVLLVVAADDGPRAQTIEHLELLDALGIEHGLAVISKIDLVDDARRTAVVGEVQALLRPTRLAAARVLVASAVSKHGIEELRRALADLAARVSGVVVPAGPARLAIDRVFTMRGRGVVVTGSLRGRGGLDKGISLRLEPGARTVRAREIQVHGQAVERVDSGGRTAINLAGVEAADVSRGMVVAAGPGVEVSDRLLVALRPPAQLAPKRSALPADRARVRLHIGTQQVDCVLVRAGREAVALPNGQATAVLRLDSRVAISSGDHFVLRQPSLGGTAAGGLILDAHPARGPSRRRTNADRLARLADAAEANDPELLAAALLDLHGTRPAANLTALADDVRADLRRAALDAVATGDSGHANGSGVALTQLRSRLAGELRRLVTLSPADAAAAASNAINELVAAGDLLRDGETVRDPARTGSGISPALVGSMERLLDVLAVPAPPPLAEAARSVDCAAQGVRLLESEGRIVRLEDDLAWEAATYRALEWQALQIAERTPLTPAVFRDATGTSRRYVMAILDDLNRRGLLRRTDAGHVLGPRAPAPATPRP